MTAARCTLDDAGWRAVLEAAAVVTAEGFEAHALTAGAELARLARRGHEARPLAAEWIAALPPAQRVQLAPRLGELVGPLEAMVRRAREPGGAEAMWREAEGLREGLGPQARELVDAMERRSKR